jgi:hypothetical protein
MIVDAPDMGSIEPGRGSAVVDIDADQVGIESEEPGIESEEPGIESEEPGIESVRRDSSVARWPIAAAGVSPLFRGKDRSRTTV